MATRGAGPGSDDPRPFADDIAALDALISTLQDTGVGPRDQLRQLIADLDSRLEQPGFSLLDYLQEACGSHGLVATYTPGEGLTLCLAEAEPDAPEAQGRLGAEHHGRYLCEHCFDALTDAVVPAGESPTGMEMACCAPCRAAQGLA